MHDFLTILHSFLISPLRGIIGFLWSRWHTHPSDSTHLLPRKRTKKMISWETVAIIPNVRCKRRWYTRRFSFRAKMLEQCCSTSKQCRNNVTMQWCAEDHYADVNCRGWHRRLSISLTTVTRHMLLTRWSDDLLARWFHFESISFRCICTLKKERSKQFKFH